jgi:hypothetical protein
VLHPRKPGWFIEAVTVWGRDGVVKAEPRSAGGGMNSNFPTDMRLLLAHKQKTSARVRFLRFAHGMSAFSALPALSAVQEDLPASRVEMHPGLYLRSAEAELGLASGSLALEPEFSASVDTPGRADQGAPGDLYQHRPAV